MPDFYSVDRRCIYNVGETLGLISADEIIKFVDLMGGLGEFDSSLKFFLDMFPDGLSRHGFDYMIKGFQSGDVSQSIEVTYELVRRHHFPHLPSRLQCYFGTTLDAVNLFRAEQNCMHNKIYQLSTDDYFEADMELLKYANNAYITFELAHKYWSGMKTDNPKIEYLLKNPVVMRECK